MDNDLTGFILFLVLSFVLGVGGFAGLYFGGRWLLRKVNESLADWGKGR